MRQVMKKYILLCVIVLAVTATVLMGCGAPTAEEPTKSADTVTSQSTGVFGNIVEVRYNNPTGREMYFGEYYELEKLESGTWIKMPLLPNVGFNDIALILEAGKSVNKTYHLNYCYENLTAGHYRITTEITDLGTQFPVSAEFDLASAE
jgi:hypothetical protein